MRLLTCSPVTLSFSFSTSLSLWLCLPPLERLWRDDDDDDFLALLSFTILRASRAETFPTMSRSSSEESSYRDRDLDDELVDVETRLTRSPELIVLFQNSAL